MQTLLTNMKKNEGYISIETIIIAGLIIALGAFLITKFADSGQDLSEQSFKRVGELASDYADLSNFEN